MGIEELESGDIWKRVQITPWRANSCCGIPTGK